MMVYGYKTLAALNWWQSGNSMAAKITRYVFFRLLYVGLCEKFVFYAQVKSPSHMEVRIEQSTVTLSTESVEKI